MPYPFRKKNEKNARGAISCGSEKNVICWFTNYLFLLPDNETIKLVHGPRGKKGGLGATSDEIL